MHDSYHSRQKMVLRRLLHGSSDPRNSTFFFNRHLNWITAVDSKSILLLKKEPPELVGRVVSRSLSSSLCSSQWFEKHRDMAKACWPPQARANNMYHIWGAGGVVTATRTKLWIIWWCLARACIGRGGKAPKSEDSSQLLAG